MTTTRDPIGYAAPEVGALYCPGCTGHALAGDGPYPDLTAVYDHDEHGPEGLTCDRCGEEIVPADKLAIWQDQDAEDPRRDWGDPFGTFYVPRGNRYVTGDDGATDPTDLTPEEVAVALPVYAYVHGGVRLSTGPFGCPWDSGQVGAIYCTVADLVAEYGADTPETRERAAECLRGEIETLDTYYRGDVWGYTYERGGEVVDSCGGIYGSDNLPDELPAGARALYDAGTYTETV